LTAGDSSPQKLWWRAWEKYILYQEDFHRGGSSEIEAVVNLRRGLKPPYTGMYNAYNHSDGAAMRAAPIGIVCAGDLEKAARFAQIDAEVSHFRDGVWGCPGCRRGSSLRHGWRRWSTM